MSANAVRKIQDIKVNETLAKQLESTLTEMLSKTLRIDAAEIDVTRPLPHYGLDSIDAVTLAGDLEDWLNVDLPSTLLWDYPTVAAIAGFLEEQLDAMPEVKAKLEGRVTESKKQGVIDKDDLDDLDRLDPQQMDELLSNLIP